MKDLKRQIEYNFIYIKYPRIQNKQIYRHKIDYSFSRSRKRGKEGECLKAWVGIGGNKSIWELDRNGICTSPKALALRMTKTPFIGDIQATAPWPHLGSRASNVFQSCP